jgi:hypothetical protein
LVVSLGVVLVLCPALLVSCRMLLVLDEDRLWCFQCLPLRFACMLVSAGCALGELVS